jgi:pimeloyl-ACP methyl ester carboxylesterase
LARNRFTGHGSSRIGYELDSRPGCRKPWLVLIQGLGFDRSGWAPVVSPLRRRFHLVLIDNRGSGRSTTQDRAFTVADMAADVAAVLEASQIARAHVLGASLGGMVGPGTGHRAPPARGPPGPRLHDTGLAVRAIPCLAPRFSG